MDPLEELRNQVLAECNRLQATGDSILKTEYRAWHEASVEHQLKQQQKWIRSKYPQYAKYFASGSEVQPSRIQPLLVEVTETWQANLFRLARLTWSLPYTRGYGRRLRFLIMDASNDKLIGVLGLQSPPLDFPARDRLFSYPKGQKIELVNQTMDIYTLGAVPPYGRLLGGKLVALAAASDEVRNAYTRKYKDRVTEMNQGVLPSHLLALTTTSAFGRSSLYNRLRYRDRVIARSIGYTEGYGSFHLATLYPLLRTVLEQQGISTKGGFGVGPRIVWQTCVRALRHLGLPKKLLKHGVKREVFLFPLVSNLKDCMEDRAVSPIYYSAGFEDLAAWWRQRWLLGRAERVDGWHAWDRNEIESMLLIPESGK